MRTGVILALLIAVCVLFTVHGSTAPVNAESSSVVNGSETVIEIQLQPDGDADISVETIVPLRNANDTAGFNQTKVDYQKGAFKDKTKTIDVFRQAAAASGTESNRSMSIDNESINRTAYIEEDIGKYVLEFTWRNFSNRTVTEEGIILKTNDSFRTAQGTWLSVLGSNQSLAIRGPEGYQIIDSKKGVENRYIVWSGPRSFSQGDFAITYADYRPPQSSTPSPKGPFEFDSLSNPIVGLSMIITLVAIISVGVFAFSRRDGLLRRVTTDGGVGMSSTNNAYGPPPAPDSDINNETDGEIDHDSIETETDTDAASTDTDADDDSASGEDGIDVELLSDEERVERLLEERGGRMKQANIVRETDWSNAKVSQLLSAMDEDGRIEKLRIGRENLISLSNHGENDQNSS